MYDVPQSDGLKPILQELRQFESNETKLDDLCKQESLMPFDESRPPAVNLLRKLGMEPDPWQVEVLDGDQPRLLLNCSRQAGKSTVVAMLGLAQAIFVPGTKVLLVSRSHRQSKELVGIVAEFYLRFKNPKLELFT